MRSFWTDKRVAVTGGAGSLSSVVVEQLRQRGCRRICVPGPYDYNLARMDGVRRLYADTSPDVVVHLQSPVGGMRLNETQAIDFCYDSFMITRQLMEAGCRRGIEKFVVLTAMCAHSEPIPGDSRNERLSDPPRVRISEPCELTNKMVLVQAQAYRQRYGFNSVVLWPVNIYGPGDYFDEQTPHVIPALIRKCVEAQERGEQCIVLPDKGLLEQEFLYVDDAAEGIVLAAGQCGGNEPMKLGSGEPITVQALAELIAAEVGFEGDLIWDPGDFNETDRHFPDAETAKQLFCFEPRWELCEGIRRTVAWFRSNRARVGRVGRVGR
ncbi:MAG: NAD-dependent epimerase/dehydratase family protein [Nitrospiraceae bacterium]